MGVTFYRHALPLYRRASPLRIPLKQKTRRSGRVFELGESSHLGKILPERYHFVNIEIY